MSPQATAFTVTARFPESPSSLQVELTIDPATQQPSVVRALIGPEDRKGSWTEAGTVIEISSTSAIEPGPSLALQPPPQNLQQEAGTVDEFRVEKQDDRTGQREVSQGTTSDSNMTADRRQIQAGTQSEDVIEEEWKQIAGYRVKLNKDKTITVLLPPSNHRPDEAPRVVGTPNSPFKIPPKAATRSTNDQTAFEHFTDLLKTTDSTITYPWAELAALQIRLNRDRTVSVEGPNFATLMRMKEPRTPSPKLLNKSAKKRMGFASDFRESGLQGKAVPFEEFIGSVQKALQQSELGGDGEVFKS